MSTISSRGMCHAWVSNSEDDTNHEFLSLPLFSWIIHKVTEWKNSSSSRPHCRFSWWVIERALICQERIQNFGRNGISMQLNGGATATTAPAAPAAPAATGPWGAPTRPTPTRPWWLAANTDPCGAPHPWWLAATSGPWGAPKRSPPLCHAPSSWFGPTSWLLAATSFLLRPALPPSLKFNSSGLSKSSLPEYLQDQHQIGCQHSASNADVFHLLPLCHLLLLDLVPWSPLPL